MKSIKYAFLGIGLLALFILHATLFSSIGVDVESPLDFNMMSIDGEEVDLAGFKGKVVARFEPRTAPDSPEVISAIESAISD
jgi:glutathione peroxidase-family protein